MAVASGPLLQAVLYCLSNWEIAHQEPDDQICFLKREAQYESPLRDVSLHISCTLIQSFSALVHSSLPMSLHEVDDRAALTRAWKSCCKLFLNLNCFQLVVNKRIASCSWNRRPLSTYLIQKLLTDARQITKKLVQNIFLSYVCRGVVLALK